MDKSRQDEEDETQDEGELREEETEDVSTSGREYRSRKDKHHQDCQDKKRTAIPTGWKS